MQMKMTEQIGMEKVKIHNYYTISAHKWVVTKGYIKGKLAV